MHCCAVLDTFSREVVGWSIDTAADSRLVVNALDTAIETRSPGAGGIVHAGHGARFTSWAFTDEVRAAGLGAPPAKRGNTEIFYNRQRLHSRLNYASPVEHELRYAASVPA